MTKQQKELILNLLSNNYVNVKEELNILQRKADIPQSENEYRQKMKFIEETYKEVEKL